MNKEEDWDIVIKPKSSFFRLNFKELWTYKDLILLMAKRDVVTVYKQTILGPLWMIIQPIFATAIYTFTFSATAKISTDGVPPILFYLLGQTFWTYFSDSLSKTSNTFLANAGVFGKVYFPRLVVPVSIILSNLAKFFIQLCLLLFVFLYYFNTTNSLNPNIYILFVPFLLLSLGIFGSSLGIIFSSVTTKYRDFSFLLGFAIQLLMYASCIVFPLSIYTGLAKKIFMLNPIVNIMEAIKFALTGHGQFNTLYLLMSLVSIVIIMFIGILMFNRTEKSFMDTV